MDYIPLPKAVPAYLKNGDDIPSFCEIMALKICRRGDMYLVFNKYFQQGPMVWASVDDVLSQKQFQDFMNKKHPIEKSEDK